MSLNDIQNHNMEAEQQMLLTLLPFVSAVMQLKFAFNNAPSAYMDRKEAIMKAIYNKGYFQ